MKMKNVTKLLFLSFALLPALTFVNTKNDNVIKLTSVSDNPVVMECDYQGHGVDFSNGVISYRMREVMHTSFNTFEALIKISNTTHGHIGSIFSNDTGQNSNYSTIDVTSEGYLRVSWNGGEGAFIFDEFNLKNGCWNFVTFVRDKANDQVRYYVNGDLITTINVTLTDTYVRERPMFGCDPKRWRKSKMPFQGHIKYAYGYLDARNQTEIRDDFHNLDDVNYESRGSSLLFSYEFTPNLREIKDGSAFRNNLYFTTNDYYYKQDFYDTKDYTFSILGDPQMVVSYHNHYGNYIGALDTTMDYLIDHVDDQKIVMTMCTGDLANMQSSSTEKQKNYEWNYVGKTFAKLDNKVNYIVTPGNHDYDTITKVDHTLEYMNAEGRFPLSKFQVFDYYGGAYDETNIANTYYLLEAGGVKYLFLCLDYGPTDEVIAWADTIVKTYSDRRVVLLTHSYLTHYGDIVKSGESGAPSNSGWKDTEGLTVNDGEDIYNKLIYPNDNFFMVVCGHVVADDILLHKSPTKGGNTVYEFMVNAQGLLINDGLDSLMGLFTFDELNQSIFIDYYSTYHQKSYNVQNHFEVSFKGTTHLLSDLYYNEDGSLKGGA